MADSEDAVNGPSRDSTPARGLSSLGEPMPILCADCGWPIGGTTAAVETQERTRSDYRSLQDGEHGAWCHRCKRLTVWRVAS